MDLTHRFSLPASRDEAWNAFAHLQRLAPCFPGAKISPSTADAFTGSVKVKLGPVALLYQGAGRYVRKDPDAGRIVIETAGKDQRGSGTASAIVTVTLTEAGERTEVEVATDLTLTGKPAQLGDAVVADVSGKLVAQFVDCISDRFAEGLGDPEPARSVEENAVDEPPVELGTAPEELDGPATGVGAGGDSRPEAAPPDADFATASSSAAGTTPTPRAAYVYHPPSDTSQTHLDVLTTALPAVLKKLWPAIAGAVVTFAVLNRVLKRRLG